MTTPTTDRLEASEGERLELRPARLQGWAMTLMPLTILGAFTAVLWFGVEAMWSCLLAPVAAAFGVWVAVIGNRQMRRLRVRADAEGVPHGWVAPRVRGSARLLGRGCVLHA